MTNTTLVMSSVLPSGAARAAASVPMAVPPPGRFSIIIVTPWVRPICSPSRRAMMSAVPPGGYGLTILTVPVCEIALWPNARRPKAPEKAIARASRCNPRGNCMDFLPITAFRQVKVPRIPATKNQVLLARQLWENIHHQKIQYPIEMVLLPGQQRGRTRHDIASQNEIASPIDAGDHAPCRPERTRRRHCGG